jgi:LmbE family N-acetylglucosaminyl deacetylase
MRHRVTLLAAAVLAAASAAAAPPLDVGQHERLLIVSPHPDDETLAAAGLIQRVLARAGSARVLLVTAGDGYIEAVVRATGEPRPRPTDYVAYGERRVREARAAMRELGRGSVRLELLGFPDGGLRDLLDAYWAHGHPESSPTTGAREPPYPDALDREVAYDGADLRRELVQVLRETQPTILAFPDPVDRHPDHRAAGLFTLLALETWSHDLAPMPRLLAYLVHWPDWPPGWNATAPGPNASAASLDLPANLPPRKIGRVSLALSDAEVRAKQAALAHYTSQQEATASLLAAFVRRTEPFSVFTRRGVERVDGLIAKHLSP